MRATTTLAQEIFWLAVSIAILVLFIPTAVSTVMTTSDWTAGFIDLSTGEAELPVWSTFGLNGLLVLLAACMGVLNGILLVRRWRLRQPSDADPVSPGDE